MVPGLRVAGRSIEQVALTQTEFVKSVNEGAGNPWSIRRIAILQEKQQSDRGFWIQNDRKRIGSKRRWGEEGAKDLTERLYSVVCSLLPACRQACNRASAAGAEFHGSVPAKAVLLIRLFDSYSIPPPHQTSDVLLFVSAPQLLFITDQRLLRGHGDMDATM